MPTDAPAADSNSSSPGFKNDYFSLEGTLSDGPTHTDPCDIAFKLNWRETSKFTTYLHRTIHESENEAQFPSVLRNFRLLHSSPSIILKRDAKGGLSSEIYHLGIQRRRY